MKLTLFILILFININAYATFSIIAMDKETNESGAVMGTCLPTLRIGKIADDLVNYTDGFGIMIFQAKVNDFSDTWFNTAVGFMDQDEPYYTATVINNHLSNKIFDPLYQTRQILTVKKDKYSNITSNVYTGDDVGKESFGVTGTSNNGRFTYAIAGNLLTHKNTLLIMKNTFKNSKGSLSDKLVLALSKIGKIKNYGDIRCKENLISSNHAFLRTFKGSELEYDIQVSTFLNQKEDAAELLEEEYELNKIRH
ncbi:DUF1028 domain-containing protein [Silvanigrella paludirubra]|uniref:DUF1028 domain-containing protein n=1 Tax=Silvanigrella paludirubra TaxID=2499159 RepID=A0A6N6VPF7_9BACT|nr:DUF1028 domain-containing protein [Silvanigrella paludirubra]KAB8036087.1 DUF1028 domain-containing protein [Silvanigrella paludirubra]